MVLEREVTYIQQKVVVACYVVFTYIFKVIFTATDIKGLFACQMNLRN
jgi:hypothetical protein